MPHPFYDISLLDSSGKPINLSDFRGRKILIVNVAEKCGLSGQMNELVKLQADHHESLKIICCPSSSFFQEFRSNAKIAQDQACSLESRRLLHTELLSVRGASIHPLFAFLTKKALNGHKDVRVWWNFQKFLVDENGEWQNVYLPPKSPLSQDITKEIAPQFAPSV